MKNSSLKNELMLSNYFELRPTALIIKGDVPYEAWAAGLEQLKYIEGSVHWWIGDMLNYGENRYGEKYAQAVDMTGLSYDTIKQDKWVCGQIELCTRVHNLDFTHHREVASLEKQEQVKFLTEAEENNWTTRQLHQAVREYKHQALMAAQPELPVDRYDVIIIDPPWPMEKIPRKVAPQQQVMDYPTMSIDEIQDMAILALASENCHLFVWSTQKYLPDAMRIIELWGFRYILTMVWHKTGGFQPFGLPQYNCEFILYARQGTPEFIDTKSFFCCFNGKRREHSRKPDEFYDIIKRTTSGKRLDIFSREVRNGFEQYGNEPGKF